MDSLRPGPGAAVHVRGDLVGLSPMLWLKGVAQAEQRYFPESASEDGAATLLVRLRGVLRADGSAHEVLVPADLCRVVGSGGAAPAAAAGGPLFGADYGDESDGGGGGTSAEGPESGGGALAGFAWGAFRGEAPPVAQPQEQHTASAPAALDSACAACGRAAVSSLTDLTGSPTCLDCARPDLVSLTQARREYGMSRAAVQQLPAAKVRRGGRHAVYLRLRDLEEAAAARAPAFEGGTTPEP